jgi:hypothetical protein
VGERGGFELRQGRGTGHTHVITKVQIRRVGFGLERQGSRGLSSWEPRLREKIDDIRAIFSEEGLVAIGVEVLLVAWYLLRVVESRCADRV